MFYYYSIRWGKNLHSNAYVIVLTLGALSDPILVSIASQIAPNWESFARVLGVPERLITLWKSNYPGNTNRILRAAKALIWWRNNNGKGDLDTLAKLLRFLNQANRSDISRNIMTKYFPKGNNYQRILSPLHVYCLDQNGCLIKLYFIKTNVGMPTCL